jgi:hypothetical protein
MKWFTKMFALRVRAGTQERRGPKKEVHLKALRGIYFGEDCRATESDRSAGCVELLENETYAKEKSSSGFIALDVRPIAGLGWRAIHPTRGNIFREHRI